MTARPSRFRSFARKPTKAQNRAREIMLASYRAPRLDVEVDLDEWFPPEEPKP